MLKILIPLLSLSLVANITFASQWKLAKNQDGIQVYTRKIPNSAIHEFKGIVTITTSLDSVVGVFDDIQACPQWVFQCTQPALIQSLGFNERIVYQVNDFPFPSRNRDLILYAKLSQNPQTKIITVKLEASPSYCHNKRSAICQQINQSKMLTRVLILCLCT